MRDLPTTPDAVFIQHDETVLVPAQRNGERWTTAQAELQVSADAVLRLHCPQASVSRVVLRWELAFPADTLFLGDAWERGYGDLQWRHRQPERIMPWYFAAHHPGTGETFAAGVKTQPAALCFWTADAKGVSLWLDVRNGGMPSVPGDRILELATIVTTCGSASQSPMEVLRAHCRAMSPAPRPVAGPICGNNNWYYSYGSNFDQHQVMRDAELLAELAAGHRNRPYCVIDAGWSPGGNCPGGPWTAGWPDRFPDMAALARRITAAGVRPGIWIRPTALSVVDDPRRLRPGPQPLAEKAIDLTLEENLQQIREDVARVRSWGYELIKHDFSTWDAFARWGFDFGAEMTEPTWHWSNRALTNAEVLLQLYRTLRQAADDAVLIGCNTIGHLGAGLFELQRTGDDTSGRLWERTRRMGINTLAFRLPQHSSFFQCDADCVAHTPFTPWDKDRQFLDLVASSGTPLFVSADPTTVPAEAKSAMRQAMQLALSGGSGAIEPLDWLWTTCPELWRIQGKTVRYDWTDLAGAWPLRC